MKAKLLILSFFIALVSHGQVEAPRSTEAVIPVDPHGAFTYSLKMPVRPDTATALARAGKDSLGLIFFNLTDKKVYVRDSSAPWGHKWSQLGAGGGGGSGTDSALAALYGVKIYISGTTKYIVVDTNAITTRFNRDKLKDSVFGVLNAAISAKLSTVSVTNSITGDGASNPLKLSGDAASPGNSQYYGTNSSGSKGFFALPAGTADSAIGALWGLRKIISGTVVYVGPDSFLVVSQARLLKVIDSLSALSDTTDYHEAGTTGIHSLYLSQTSHHTTLIIPKIRGLNSVSIVTNGTDSATEIQLVNDAASPGNGYYYGTNGSGTKGFYVLPSGVAPANSTATIGLTRVSGSNSTFMRSDEAPPLSQAIVPNWTGVHTFGATPILSTLSGYVKANSGSPLTASTTIPFSDLATIAPHNYLGNNGGTTVAPFAVSNTQLTADLNPYTSTLKGLVPSPGGTTSHRALFDDVGWAAISFPSILFRYNVVDGGADSTGNNATATRKAIQNTINLAAASPLPAAIVFPSGNYLIDSTIVIPKAMAIEGYNAYVIASDATPYDMFKILADSVRLRGLKLFGVSKAQVGIDINGYKYFSYRDGEASSLRYGFRGRNTSATYNAGDLDGCNFFGDSVGVFSDTLGEYVTVRGGLMKGNTVAVWDRGGNNSFIGNNINFNTTAFKFTGESNNSHGIIDGVNANHNNVSFDVNGAVYGETVTNSHFYEGDMNFVSSSNWRFINTIYAPANLKIWQCAWMDFSESHPEFTYGLNLNLQGNLTPPTFGNNFGPAVINMTTVNPTMNYPMDSLGGYPYRKVLTGDTLDLGITRWWTKSLSGTDTIKRIIHPTLGRTYRVEVQANGYNMVMLDNTKIDGTFNPSAALNVFTLECIDAGADPRFIVRVSQPGVLVARSTTAVGWGRPTGAVTISGANITKTGPDALSFTGWAVPDKALASGDGYYSFQAISTYANLIAGFSKTAAQNSYNNMDFGIYFFGSSGGANNININENGTLISSGLGGTNWTTNDSFRIKRTGTTITYEKYSGGAWNVFYTSTHSSATTDKLYPQVAIRALTTFTNPRIIGTNVINNMTDQAFIAPYADGINATSSSGSGTSGIYLPTITNSSNAASITSDSAIWSRVDNTVTVSGHCTITPTSGSANTIIDITVPVNSLLSGGKGLWGNGMTSQTTNGGIGCVISSSGTANIAHATTYQTGGTTAFQLYYQYQYRVQ